MSWNVRFIWIHLLLFTRPQMFISCLADTSYPQQLCLQQHVLCTLLGFSDHLHGSKRPGFVPAVYRSRWGSHCMTSSNWSRHLTTKQTYICGFFLVTGKEKFSCTWYVWQHADLCKRCGLWTSRLKCTALHSTITPTPPVWAVREVQHTGFHM